MSTWHGQPTVSRRARTVAPIYPIMTAIKRPYAAGNLPPAGSSNAKKPLQERLQEPAIQWLIKEWHRLDPTNSGVPLAPLPNARHAAEATGTPVASVYATIQKLRDSPLAVELPPNFRQTHSDVRVHDHGMYRYPIYDKVPTGALGGAYPASEPLGTFVTDLHVRPMENRPPPFALRVSGHGMTNPAALTQFPDGALVLCDPSQMPDLKDFVVALDRTDGSLTLKQLTNRAPLPERDLWLTPLNPDPAYSAVPLDDENHEVLGVVVDAVLPLYRHP